MICCAGLFCRIHQLAAVLFVFTFFRFKINKLVNIVTRVYVKRGVSCVLIGCFCTEEGESWKIFSVYILFHDMCSRWSHCDGCLSVNICNAALYTCQTPGNADWVFLVSLTAYTYVYISPCHFGMGLVYVRICGCLVNNGTCWDSYWLSRVHHINQQ